MKHFFTIIELLVVIAIITVLAAMLLPALNKARAKGYQAKCIGNLKNINQMHSMYVSDNDDMTIIAKQSTAANNAVPSRWIWHGLFYYDYLGAPKFTQLFNCPLDIRRMQPWSPGRMSYGINYARKSSTEPLLPHEQCPSGKKMGKISRPSFRFMFPCGNAVASGWVGWLNIDMKISWNNTHASPWEAELKWMGHSNGSNIGMLDGSVQFFTAHDVAGPFNSGTYSTSGWRKENQRRWYYID